MNNASDGKKIFAYASTIAILAIIAIIFKNNSTEAKPASQEPLVKVQTAEKSSELFPIEISGFVRGTNYAQVAPMSNGRILSLPKKEGDFVNKGEILAIIDSPQTDAGFEAANAMVSALKKTLKESEDYYDQTVDQAETAKDEYTDSDSSAEESWKTSKKARDLQIQATKNQLTSALGNLEIARANKNTLFLTAPFSGRISAINGRVGGFANFSMPLITLSADKNFEITTYVPAQDGKKITSGMNVNLKNSEGAPFSGIVTAVAYGSDEQSLKTLVKISVDNTAGIISLGDFLKGSVLVPRKTETLKIPQSAVVVRGGDQTVFVIEKDTTAAQKSIVVSDENENFINISEGISAGEKIVIEGQQFLSNGIKVKIYGE